MTITSCGFGRVRPRPSAGFRLLNFSPNAGARDGRKTLVLCEHTRNIVNIVSATQMEKSVTTLVYSSAILTGQHESCPGFDPNGFMSMYFLAKHEIEEMVRGSELQWTILRPALLMKTLVPPLSDFNFPELGSESVILSAFKRDICLTMFSEGDVGAFAAEALMNPETRLGAEMLGLTAIARCLSDACGKEIVVKFRTNEEVEELKGKHPNVDSQILSNHLDFVVDLEGLEKGEKYGIKLTSFKEYLAKHKEEVEKGLSF